MTKISHLDSLSKRDRGTDSEMVNSSWSTASTIGELKRGQLRPMVRAGPALRNPKLKSTECA